ncbi:hypothetical protein [Candidatus Nanohalovita haloferacivicina]|uniref:hypothetical protein n=1 Tax=Candidatus Nanohalovita haloferacivicina TaxID=2978046 RepID=UPI00325FCD1E|nr:hypothetical protein HBNXNv_0596 [Candidatus Nanohalobia archaeon BNXNv]
MSEGNGVYIQDVPYVVDSQEELEENYDFVRAVHGTTSRFHDSISEHGIVPSEDLLTVEKSKSDDPIIFFGPRDSEEVEEMGSPSVEVYSDAKNYAERATGQHFGGKSMLVYADLPVENLVPDDVSKVDHRDVNTPYESIVEYAVVGHEGVVEPEILAGADYEGNTRPPVHNQTCSTSEEGSEFFQALQNEDLETADEIASNYDPQIDLMEHAEVLGDDLRPHTVMEREHPDVFN